MNKWVNEGIQALFYQDFYEAKKPVSSENKLPSPFNTLIFFLIHFSEEIFYVI